MDAKFVTRLVCICLSCTLNLVLLAIVLFKIFYQKKRTLNICFKALIAYLVFGFFTPFYNILYRFVITESMCFASDTIEEGLVVFTRCLVLFFYIVRLRRIFINTPLEISKPLLYFLLMFMLLYSIIIPCLWIPRQSVTAYPSSNFGIYCSNTGNMWVIVVYYIFDFAFTVFVTYLYLARLHRISQIKTNDIVQHRKKNIHRRLVKKTIVLTSISIVSSWIIMYPSYLSTNAFLAELRWFYPLDYGINALCLFFMFKWKTKCDCIRTRLPWTTKTPEMELSDVVTASSMDDTRKTCTSIDSSTTTPVPNMEEMASSPQIATTPSAPGNRSSVDIVIEQDDHEVP